MKSHGLAIAAGGAALIAAALALWAAGAPDIALYRQLHLGAGSALVAPTRVLTALGAFSTMLLVVLAAAALLCWRRRAGDAILLAAVFVAVRVVVSIAKAAVHRPRPPVGERLQHVDSWSFPSSHAADALTVLMLIALLSGRGRVALAAALAGSLAIGWSRLALGVHYPSDVLAGWGIGLSCIGLAIAARPGLAGAR